MKVLVAVGTHEQPFQRLLDTVSEMHRQVAFENIVWRVQYGTGDYQATQMDELALPYLDSVQMKSSIQWADVMIAQASPGLLFGALEAGTWPLLVGRQKIYGEHVDDHQTVFAAYAARQGWATATSSRDELVGSLGKLATESLKDLAGTARSKYEQSVGRSEEFRKNVWRVLSSSEPTRAG